MKVVIVKPLKENVYVKNLQTSPNNVLTHKQNQYLRTEKYKKQLRRNIANQSSRNIHKCHCHYTCCSMTTNLQGNQIPDSQGKRYTDAQQIVKISKTKQIQKQKPMVDEAQ